MSGGGNNYGVRLGGGGGEGWGGGAGGEGWGVFSLAFHFNGQRFSDLFVEFNFFWYLLQHK